MTRRTSEQIQYEIDLLKGDKREAEAREFEDQNRQAKKTLTMFGFKYSEIIPIVVKYEKLIGEVRLLLNK